MANEYSLAMRVTEIVRLKGTLTRKNTHAFWSDSVENIEKKYFYYTLSQNDL